MEMRFSCFVFFFPFSLPLDGEFPPRPYFHFSLQVVKKSSERGSEVRIYGCMNGCKMFVVRNLVAYAYVRQTMGCFSSSKRVDAWMEFRLARGAGVFLL